ncbi:MAG: bifunctional folylpolyglutamate synthase/dihydrofolate synthase [Proteobacteria bacterium]|nr:bifunctional folylpolyglutamate synthase/dihydrofolate synthase [Pseudomonadota bacterium]MBU1741592.1 bifunctional folylpolyglutamate synthase/dihydrofolate synthase [Pseudomonadota bacterium]
MTVYQKCVDRLFGLQMFGIKLGLNSTRNLLDRLGRPEDGLNFIHLAGTNGKGSVGAMIAAILDRAGSKVGFYTSPHLVTFRERFAVNGRMISKHDVVRLADLVWAVADERQAPTFFEFVTAMALIYFREQGVDWVVWETGLGGRLDATNVVTPRLAVITNVFQEHTEHLGKTIGRIAFEKAGIIKPNVPTVTAAQNPTALRVIAQTCAQNKSRLIRVGRDVRYRAASGVRFNYYGLARRLKNLATNLVGPHQRRNAATACAAIEALGLDQVTEDHIRHGLQHVHWPGRLEVFSAQPLLILDGAHNPAAARTLALALDQFRYRRAIVVAGVMADKNVAGVLGPILSLADTVIYTRPEYFRAADPSRLAAEHPAPRGKTLVAATVPEAVEGARRMAGKRDLILVTGSLFVVGEARAHLTGRQTDILK